MALCVFIRKTTDWLNMTLEDLDPRVTNIHKLKKAINIWDKVCSIPYFQYRAILKEITISSFSHPVVPNPMLIKDDDWLIPTDDDDWTGIKQLPQNADFVYWETLIYSSIHGKCYISSDAKPTSNGYAVRGWFLKQLPDAVRVTMLQEHQKSLKLAKEHSKSIIFIDEVLSAYNEHAGCAHFLKSITNTKVLHSVICKDLPIIENTQVWLAPCVEKFSQVHKRLND